MKVARYFRTLRHLRCDQIFGQIRVRLLKKLRNPSRVLASPSPRWLLGTAAFEQQVPDPVPAQAAEALVRGDFQFIGRSAALGNPIDWTAAGQPRLWQYNLHYFDWLWSLLPEGNPDWAAARRLTLDWIDRHKPARNACGWEPYPTSLRLINWALLFGLRHRETTERDEEFRDALLESIGRQVRWLELNLETHIQANHLLENLAAMACVASVFEGADRERILGKTLPMMECELAEQVPTDGMHYERSPMYQLRVLWLMDMLTLVGRPGLRQLTSEPAAQMREALRCLRHPDGDIALVNDAATGVYLDSWPGNAASGAWSLPDAGYFGFRSATGDYLIMDAGAIGPDHQPGHGHADFLSYELSLGGTRVVTDTGIGTYDAGLQRDYERSTAAHNTVEVGGENSAEVWGSFRVGRRCVPSVHHWEARPDGFLLDAGHSGYRHLPSKAVHRRSFKWEPGSLQIMDRVEVALPVDVVGRIHFAPGVVARLGKGCVSCTMDDTGFRIQIEGDVSLALEESSACVAFGMARTRQVLVMRGRAQAPCFQWRQTFHWEHDPCAR